MTRPRFTAAQRLKCFEDHGAIVLCQAEDCDNAMYVKGCEIDHWLALVDGGAHTNDNLRPICASCHRKKSAREHRNNAKCKRVAKKHSGQAPKPGRRIQNRISWPKSSTPLPSRKFPKRKESQP